MQHRPTPPALLVFGEALVDFLPGERGRLAQVHTFHKCPGGAPANLAIVAARLGVPVRLMGAVGADPFGDYLRAALTGEGVDTSTLITKDDAKTGIGFIALDAHGERDFMFFREKSADLSLTPADFHGLSVDGAIFHCGSNTMTNAGGWETTWGLMQQARAAGAVLSLDVNLRHHLWDDPAALRERLCQAMAAAHLVKLSDEECAFFAGDGGLPALAARLAPLQPPPEQVLVESCGAAGARLLTQGRQVAVPAFATEVVDTTGAGDAFWAAFLTGLIEVTKASPGARVAALLQVPDAAWGRLLRLATFAGAHACTALGATTAVLRPEHVPWERIDAPHT